jgi:hypothetical protein
MTDQTLLSPPDEPSEPIPVAPNPPHRDLVPWLYGLGFVVLAAAIIYLWQYPSVPSETANDAPAIHTVEQRLADIDSRLTRLEQRPTADLGKITARVDALDGRVADQTQVAIRLDTLSGRLDALLHRDQAGLDSSKQQLDALTSRVSAIEANAGNVDVMTKRLNRIARLQEASFALASGQPIGDLPNAPEALTRFAHVAPPTEAQLRLRFPRDEETALAAKQPDDSDAPFIGRVWERAQGLVTIRRGDKIVVGNPAAVALNHARVALDAGDLAGAADAVETLKGQPCQAMANWLADAKALLNARSALAHMADQA